MHLSRRHFVAAVAGSACVAPTRSSLAKDREENAKASADPLSMVCDYSRSYVTFRSRKVHANLARLQIESRCLLLDAQGAVEEEFFQYASCKSEDEYVENKLFLDPNYDFSGVFSREKYVIFRAGSPAPANRPYAERGRALERFKDLIFQVKAARGVETLANPTDIVKATVAGFPLVGRTEIHDQASGRRAVLEYPIKTMNVQDERRLYQLDTGPIVFPDIQGVQTTDATGKNEPTALVDLLELAYIAFNRPDRAEFIIQRRRPIEHGGEVVCQVCHYSEIRELTVKNTLMSVTG